MMRQVGTGFGRAVILLAAVAVVAGCRMPTVESAKQAASEQEEPAATEPADPVAEGGPVEPGGGPGGDAELAVGDVSAVERDGRLGFLVSLTGGGGAAVTVAYASEEGTATAGRDYVTVSGTLTFASESAETREIEVPVIDDAVHEGEETLTLRLSGAEGANLTEAAATGTIVDDDRRAVAVYPEALNVEEGGEGSYTVVLGSRPTGPVTVVVEETVELTAEPREVVFAAAEWRRVLTVTVTAAADEDALADAPVELGLEARGGGYEGVRAAVEVTIVENDVTTLAAAASRAVEGAGRLGFEVTVSLASDAEVTVHYATADATADATAEAGTDYTSTSGTLTFPAGLTEARTIEVVVRDDRLNEADEEFTVRLSNAVHAVLAGGGASLTASGTITDDDQAPQLSIAAATVAEGEGALGFAVRLDAASGRTVTVDYATADGTAEAGADYTAVSGTLTFAAGATTRTIAVAVADDELDERRETFTVRLSAAVNATIETGGGTASGTITDDDAPPQLSIAGTEASEGDGTLTFAVRLDAASGRTVTVDYATADGTAEAGADYTAVSGTLTFAAGATTRTIAVSVADDELNERRETFTVRLSAAVNATIETGGGTASGTITDNDAPPQLSIAGTEASEGDGTLTFAVRLDGASGRTVTVDYATADGTAEAGADYTAVSGTLTFGGGATTRTIAVPIVDDAAHEQTETFTVTLSDPSGVTLSAATATGTITDNEPSTLSSLEVTGGGPMYPAFDADIRHYAITCTNLTTLEISAETKRSGANLTLLRANPDDNHHAVDELEVSLTDVDGSSDIAIEVGDGGDTTTYVVHCLPADFPTLKVLNRTAAATGGLLFISLPGHYAIVDYHGVPRYHKATDWARIFRPYSDGPVIDGKQVRYSMTERGSVTLLDADFQQIRTAGPLGSLTMNPHDFVLGTDSFLFISYVDTIRDFRIWGDKLDAEAHVQDSVISEVSFAGTETTRWNAWDHLKIVPDCDPYSLVNNYSFLNSLQLVDGDIIASFRGCAQVVRIDRSSGTWAIQWKLGGTDPPRSSDTEYLEIVDDPLGEFCGQHHATLTDTGRVVLFDNGVFCLGSRKGSAIVTRVVEYDISSGTEAKLTREHRRAAGHGHANHLGGVTMLDNGNWLIAWGTSNHPTLPDEEIATISEVAPDGTEVFQLNATRSEATKQTYRAYHDYEANVSVPLNLP